MGKPPALPGGYKSLTFLGVYRSRLCEEYDRLLDRGGDRRSEEAESKGTRVAFDPEQRKSSRRTAQLIGCNYKKVERIRNIRRDGTPEIREDVRNDKMSINKAYNLIRKMEQGETEDKDKSAAARIKAAKTLLTEENFFVLQAMGDDLGALLNAAVERFIDEPLEME